MKYGLEDICNRTNIQDNQIENVYLVGSRVYGTDDYLSDYDFIVVTNTNMNNQEFRVGELNVHVYTVDHFQEKLNEQKMMFIEAFHSPVKLKENVKFSFKLNEELFIKELIKNSNESVNRFAKLFDYKPYQGIKKLFHSIRILEFGYELLNDSTLSFKNQELLWKNIESAYFVSKDFSEFFELREALIKKLGV